MIRMLTRKGQLKFMIHEKEFLNLILKDFGYVSHFFSHENLNNFQYKIFKKLVWKHIKDFKFSNISRFLFFIYSTSWH